MGDTLDKLKKRDLPESKLQFCVPSLIYNSFHVETCKQPLWNERITENAKIDYHPLNSIPNTYPFLNIDYLELKNSLNQNASRFNERYSVGIIGAGIAGIACGYELMKLGYRVRIYEKSGRIGGRCYSHQFKKDPRTFCELGAMRFPRSEKLLFSYIKDLGLKTYRFPDPLVNNTVINFEGKNAYLEVDNGEKYIVLGISKTPSFRQALEFCYPFKQKCKLVGLTPEKFNSFVEKNKEKLGDKAHNPIIFIAGKTPKLIGNLNDFKEYETVNKPYYKYDLLRSVTNKFNKIMTPIINKFRVPNSPESTRKWVEFEKKNQRVSFLVFITSELKNNFDQEWTEEELMFLNTVGLGSGGFGPLNSLSCISIIKLLIVGFEEDQRGVYGGINQLPLRLWSKREKTPRGNVSLSDIHPLGRPYGGISNITKMPNGKIGFFTPTHQRGHYHDFCILTASPVVLSNNIEFSPPDLLPNRYLINNLHTMGASKVFILTKTPFWMTNKVPEGKTRLSSTLTDDSLIHQIYLQTFHNSNKGLILLSYTWEDDSNKQLAYDDKTLTKMCVKHINDIYGYNAIPFDQILESKVVHWNLMPSYHGGWVLPTGSTRIFDNDLFSDSCSTQKRVFLASDVYSYLGGWIEGSLQTSMNTVNSITKITNIEKENLKLNNNTNKINNGITKTKNSIIKTENLKEKAKQNRISNKINNKKTSKNLKLIAQ